MARQRKRGRQSVRKVTNCKKWTNPPIQAVTVTDGSVPRGARR